MKAAEPQLADILTDETTTETKSNPSEVTESSTQIQEYNSSELTTQNSEITFKENADAIKDLTEKAVELENNKNAGKSKGRRRGVWKLVKHRPIDQIEGSESQNYFSVLNMFDEIQKDNSEKRDQKMFAGLDYETFANLKPITETKSETLSETKYDNNDESIEPIEGLDIVKAGFSKEDHKDVTTDLMKIEESVPTTTIPSPIETSDQSGDQSGNIFDTFYSMFGYSDIKFKPVEEPTSSNVKENNVVSTTTVFNPTFPEEITEDPIILSPKNNTELLTIEPEVVLSTISPEEPKKFDVEPWEMKQVRTSTSTEVSHETEICYKGKCVKSKKGKIKG